jgi:hypothetical protein
MGDMAAALEYRGQAKEFLEKAWEYLAANDLHQACEKGWGAASHMAKAVAEMYDLKYTRHDHFNHVMRRAEQLTGNSMMGYWRAKASELHSDFYLRKTLLDPEVIGESLTDVASLYATLEPLVEA